MVKDWNSPIYAFFSPIPNIEYIDGQWCHTFRCLGKHCTHRICQFLDKGNKVLTGNMCKHVWSCWGKDVIKNICGEKDLMIAWKGATNYTKNGSITVAFEWNSTRKPTYLQRQHTCTETRYVCGYASHHTNWPIIYSCRAELVCWVAEDLHPFEIVKDRAFQSLMKTGRPEYYIPHPTTVLCDTQPVFANVCTCMAKMLWVSLLIMFIPQPLTLLTRHMRGNWVLQQMLGRLQTTSHLWQSQSTWLARVSC